MSGLIEVCSDFDGFLPHEFGFGGGDLDGRALWSSVSRRRVIFCGLAGAVAAFYLVVSLPLMILLFQSEYFRFLTLEEITRKISHYRTPRYVFVGDSITAGARNWGMRLGLLPTDTVNLGVSGYTTVQISHNVEKASEMEPRYVSILAGTNDVASQRFTETDFKEDYRKIWTVIDQHPEISYLVTSVPFWRDGTRDREINSINRYLSFESSRRSNVTFVDLAFALMKSGLPPEKLYADNVHFGSPAYEIWAAMIAARSK